MQDRQQQYKAFLESEFGIHVVKSLENMSNSLIREAQAATTADNGYGLIKEAAGVIKVIDYFKTGSVLK